MLCTGDGSNERLQRRNIGTLLGYAGTMLEILKAQLEPELARDTKRCRKSFYHYIKRINRTNGGPLLNGVGITARAADKAKILGAFIALVFTSNVFHPLCCGSKRRGATGSGRGISQSSFEKMWLL